MDEILSYLVEATIMKDLNVFNKAGKGSGNMFEKGQTI